MPTSANPSPPIAKSSIQFQHASLSLEVTSCQEESKNDKEKNIKKDQDQEPSMSYNYFHDVSDPFHGPFDPPCSSSFISQGLMSSPKQDQVTIYTLELIDIQNNLTTIVFSKDYTFINVIKNIFVTSNVDPIKNKVKILMLMLSKDLCQDQSLPYIFSTTQLETVKLS